jgi:hypothetical protein
MSLITSPSSPLTTTNATNTTWVTTGVPMPFGSTITPGYITHGYMQQSSVKLRKYILILKEYNLEGNIVDVKLLKEGWSTKTDDEIKSSMLLERNIKQKDLEVRTVHNEYFV